MIGLDTNILARVILGDDSKQSLAARKGGCTKLLTLDSRLAKRAGPCS